ncbi:hypothetical protein BS17DRAFT_770454 [Gyrodon lividus]|nr:hypothetical protein BS17DRAFT_770454 [Gyrodon lividus]
MVLAPDILSRSENIAMDVADVDPIPSQTHFLDILALRSPTHQAMYQDILESGIRISDACDIAQAVPIRYQDNSEPCKINYKEGLDDPIKKPWKIITGGFQQLLSIAEV